MNHTDVIAQLRRAKDPEKAEQMSAYMRNQFPFLGIPKPERAKLSREFIKAQTEIDWDLVFELWELDEREFQYLAIALLTKLKAQLSIKDMDNLKCLITSKSWWDSVDGLDILVGDIALREPEAIEIIKQWSTDDDFWLRRIAIDHQLAYKEKTDPDLLSEIITSNFGSDEFFINKAIGWSLREYSKTNPDWVRSFIEKNRDSLAPLSIREASKYL